MPSNYNGRGGPKKHDGKISDKFRDVCPPHKVKDLDALVKQCKGNETQIQAKIAEWWEEPQVEEPQWESVGKANKKQPEKKDRGEHRGAGRDSRNDRDRGGVSGGGRRDGRTYGGGARDGPRRDGKGGRGGSSGGRYGDRDRNRGGDRGAVQQKSTPAPAPAAPAPKPKESGVPTPTPACNIPAPKGAWGGQSLSFAAAAASSSASKQPTPAPPVPEPLAPSVPEQQPEEPAPVLEPEEEVPIDLGGPSVNMLSPEDPTPSGLPTAAPLVPPVATTGNVWGTKGGAHLIQAAKKPIPAPMPVAPEVEVEPELVDEPEVVSEEPEMSFVEEPAPLPEPIVEPEPVAEPEQPLVTDNTFGVSLDSVLPPSVNGSNINASGWEPILEPTETSQQPSVDISQPSPVGAISVGTAPSMPEPEPISLPKPIESAPPAVAPTAEIKPSSVLNMGHWETGDGDDDALDFGFGSFAPENDNEPSATEVTAPSAAPAAPPTSTTSAPPANATHASPARPPPGLSMPPMPANAILVHELENKLENTTLGPKVDTSTSVSEKTTTTTQSSAASSQPQKFNAVNELAGQMNPPGMSQYGGMGMYGIPPPGVPNSLGSMPPGQFPLGGNSQQQPEQSDSRPGSGPNLNQPSQQQQQQQGPYGMQQTSSTANNNNSGGANDSGAPGGAPSNNAGMPPGMPSMQYQPNPAYLYAPGQFNQMGHPAYGMQAAAYGAYGAAGQFGHPPQGPGGPQFGYGGQGLMGAGGHQGGGSAYGAPSHYDDQRGPGGPRGGGGGNMRDSHKGGRGGYRGNRNHHQNNQYGNNAYQGNPNLGGYGAGPYNMGYGHAGGYGNPAGPSGMDHYGMSQQQQQQQQQQGGAYGGFSHQDNDHNKKSSGPHGQQGGFQQQSHLHQQPLGLQGTSTDTASGSGGWPGTRQQNWGGNWQQEN